MAEDGLPPLAENYAAALKLIDEAHPQDPNKTVVAEATTQKGSSASSSSSSASPPGQVPYELHYAEKMTRWLARRCPSASPALQLACRAQHFRRYYHHHNMDVERE